MKQFNKIKQQMYDVIHSSYMCIKYPFLYPRNRFTGKHYDNIKIDRYLYGTPDMYSLKYNGTMFERVLTQPKKPGIYDKAFDVTVNNPVENEKFIHRKIKSYFWCCWFYIVKFYADYITQVFHCIPTYTEWDEVEKGMPGWNNAFGQQYLDELKTQLKKDGMLYSFRINQIKEKWGSFQLYCEGASKDVYDIISKYEHLSYKTCYDCGKPATKYTQSWILPFCDECYEKHTKNKK